MNPDPPTNPLEPFPPNAFGPQPVSDLLDPARRAAMLMVILAALSGLFAILLLAIAGFGAVDEFLRSEQVQNALRQRPPELTDDQLRMLIRILFGFFGIIALSAAVSLFALSFFVRKGGRVSTVLAIVLTSLILVWLGLNVIGGLPQLANGAAGAAFGLVLLAVPLTVGMRLMRWLIAALKNTRHLQMAWLWHQSDGGFPAVACTPSGPSGAVAAPQVPGFPPQMQAPNRYAVPPAAGVQASTAFPQPGYLHTAYLRPPQPPPGYDQPGSGPIGYGYGQADRKPEADGAAGEK